MYENWDEILNMPTNATIPIILLLNLLKANTSHSKKQTHKNICWEN